MDEPGEWSGPGPSPEPDANGSFEDFDEWTAWVDREVASRRDPVPPERVAEAQGISVGLGYADGVAPELLAAICGPDSDGSVPSSGKTPLRTCCRPAGARGVDWGGGR